MDSESRNSSSEPSEDRLRDLLESAEQRNADEWRHKGRKVSWVILPPVAAAIIWACGFLIQYDATPPKPQNPPTAEVVTELTNDQKDMAQFDAFRPNVARVVKTTEPAARSGKIIDQGDVDFAMQLLNFVQPGAEGRAKKP